MINIALIGGGGHSKVVINLINRINKHEQLYNIIGIFDDNNIISNYKYLGKINTLIEFKYNIDEYIICIGNLYIREKISIEYSSLKYSILIDPSCIIADNVKINYGTVLLSGVIIETETIIGKFSIINTNSNINHECNIGNYCNISPSSTICGNVIIKDYNFIGANSTIIENIIINSNNVIGAGSVIINNINNSNILIVGNPGKIKNKK